MEIHVYKYSPGVWRIYIVERGNIVWKDTIHAAKRSEAVRQAVELYEGES